MDTPKEGTYLAFFTYLPAPKELKELNQWLCFRLEDQGRKDKMGNVKLDKVPYNAKTGYKASSTNPKTWCSFEEAVNASSKYDGIGISFANGLCGVDVDHCIDDNGISSTQTQQGPTSLGSRKFR